MNISLKYGFFGLGMGGTSIAHACAGVRLSAKHTQRPYTALLINSNEIDLLKLPDYPNVKKITLQGYERGVGRDIQLGQEAFTVHKTAIAETIQSYFSDRDYVFICCGLGGGTGTGAVIEAIRLLHTTGFAGRFGLLLTLPRRNEGRTVLDNALQRLQVIKRAMQGLGAIVVVDNEKLFQTGLNQNQSVEDFMRTCNRHVARLLHDLNTVTASYKPYGSYHFDASEWLNLLKTGGCLHIGKCVLPAQSVDPASPVTYMEAIKQSVLNGELSAGYDLQDATSSAVSIVADNAAAKRLFTHTFVEQIQSFLHNSTPILDENPVATYVGDQPGQVTIYTVFAGLNFPEGVTKLTDELAELERRVEERNRKTDTIAEALAGFKSQVKKEAVDLETLLSEEEPAPAPNNSIVNDPFAFLNDLE
ncbi:plasmid replication protein [Paenibacillus sp. HN-1]|uniref:plasmid replication protein n=1 Tax=Paenibacillus TaxID=44249 RepID=UPI001CA9790C|nr:MULTISPECIES: plasmid replication protein [Paenibacillus]MBY9079562.1 plasmid replication protein [Paenibacillus sp. CGMCC 1.18879]MBY9083383.1 plasmid replication protein [Paenibacillus sinensis]